MSGAPIDADFQNPLNLMNPQLQQLNPTKFQNQQRGNPQHPYQPRPNSTGQYLQPSTQLPPILQRSMNFPSQQTNLTPDQKAKINEVNQMTQHSFAKHMNQIGHMNQRIMDHRMSNMSSYQTDPTPPEYAGNQTGISQHVSFPNQVSSDHVPMMQPGSYESSNNFATLDSESTMPGTTIQNTRNCECKSGQNYCASCQLCGMPGHSRPYPGPFNWKGRWCDPHYERERREAMKKYPDMFQNFSTPHQADPNSASGYSPPAKLEHQIRHPQKPYQTQHHPDRMLTTPRGVSKSSPYVLNEQNAHNFKGNNPFTLNRTTVNPSMFKPQESIDFAGYNAQGEKVRNKEYYHNSPGRQNEYDHYREYKKMNNGDFVPCNEDSMNNNYRPFQSGIPPKRMKLNRNTLTQ